MIFTASLRTFLSEPGFFFFLPASVVVKNPMTPTQFYAAEAPVILRTVAFAPSV